MKIYSLGLAVDSLLDYDFIELIAQAAQIRDLTTYKVLPHNLNETIYRIQNHQLRFLAFYDRASDTSIQFLKIYSALSENQVLYFENLATQKTASDKSIMHKQFVINKINVPKTIIIPEFVVQQKINLIESDLDILGRPFVIKPSVTTGSGDGVYLDAYSLADVQEKRNEFPEDKYLLQEKIYPKEINLKRFWFRVFFVCGTTISTWWDDDTHRYKPISNEDIKDIDVSHFNLIMNRIHDICGLKFFSTEFTVSEDNKVYVIDYVNEICDMRLQSRYDDGVPDNIVKNIADEIIRHIDVVLNRSYS
jgi:hypothetical protein